MKATPLAAGLVAILISAPAFAGLPGAQKCQAGKNQVAGKLAYCLAKAEAKLIRTAGSCSVTTTEVCYHDTGCPGVETCVKETAGYIEAVGKCTTSYQESWSKLETKAADSGDPCPTNGDVADIQDNTSDYVAGVENDTDGINETKRVFVTSGATTAAFGGLAAADTFCQNAADAVPLGGTWKAWLSTSTVNAKDRIVDGEYQLLNGQVVANDKADLIDGSLDLPINLDENSVNVGFMQVWTGSNAGGTVTAGSTCVDWTTAVSGPGTMGSSGAINDDWTDFGGAGCSSPFRMYCFEQ
jgi:hypothetical protein